MITELAFAGIVTATGLTLLMTLRADFDGALPWLALPIGTAVYLLWALLLLLTRGTLEPATGLAFTGLIGVIGLIVSLVRGNWGKKTLAWALVALGVTAITVFTARTLHLTRLTPDSLRYLLFAGEMQLPNALSEIHPPDLVNRQMGLPSLHALSALTDRRYMPSIGPLFGVSGFGFFVWLCWRAARGLTPFRRWALIGAAAVFLLSSNRLVYDAFYINTHIEVALYLVIAIAGCWLALTTREWRWAVPAGIGLAMTLLFRPEAPIVAAIILVAVAASEVGWRERIAVSAPTVVVAGVWYGLILWQHAPGGDAISATAPVFGSLVALSGAILVVLAGISARLWGLVRFFDRVMLAALLIALIGLAAAYPDIFSTSLDASFQNIVFGHGAWLFTWTIAVPILAIALLVHQVPWSRVWTIPIVGFIILWLMLPMIREGPYRVGTGDSGNRVLAHMLAVVVAFLVLAAIRSWSWTETDPGGDEPFVDIGERSEGLRTN